MAALWVTGPAALSVKLPGKGANPEFRFTPAISTPVVEKTEALAPGVPIESEPIALPELFRTISPLAVRLSVPATIAAFWVTPPASSVKLPLPTLTPEMRVDEFVTIEAGVPLVVIASTPIKLEALVRVIPPEAVVVTLRPFALIAPVWVTDPADEIGRASCRE